MDLGMTSIDRALASVGLKRIADFVETFVERRADLIA
jgi:hypothetical protein